MRACAGGRASFIVALLLFVAAGCGIRTILPAGGSDKSDSGTSGGGADAAQEDAGKPELLCGNGVIDVDEGQGVVEQCDGDNLGGETCKSLGEGEGELQCGPACFFDVSMCAPAQPTGGYGGGGEWPDGGIGDGGFPPFVPPGSDGGFRGIVPPDNGYGRRAKPAIGGEIKELPRAL